MKYEIANWRDYQHYKQGRKPPWVKLHFDFLTSPQWVLLNNDDRVLAVVCMLVASRNNDVIDGSPAGLEYLRRIGHLQSTPSLKSLVDNGFLLMLADASACKQMLADASVSISISSSDSSSDSSSVSASKRGKTNRTSNEYSADFEAIWAAYPKRSGGNPKPAAHRAYCARIKEGAVAPDAALAAVHRYARYCDATGKGGTEGVQQCATFFGPVKEGYKQDWTAPRAEKKSSDFEWQLLP